jgi:pSer/pThr/pTyr-binding forkhead associated (FHA) protein
MGDQPLNSVHLDANRREQFRRARAILMDACGDLTRMANQVVDPDQSQAGPKTVIQNLESRLPSGLEYGLMDKDCIYPLKVGLNTVGRLSDNDVILEDPYVSRRHCAIVVHTGENGFEVHDVASKNGTYLNGVKLTQPTRLVSGDEIRLCDRQLVFVVKPYLNLDATRSGSGPH